MSCGLEQIGLELAPIDAIEPGPVRQGFAAMNKAIEKLYQMLAAGQPVRDEADGVFVRDENDGLMVRAPIILWGVQIPVPPPPVQGHPGRPGDPGPAGPPGPVGDPGGWYTGMVLVYQPGGLTPTPPYGTGTIEISPDPGGSIVTGTGTNFPMWAAQGELTPTGYGTYTVLSRTNGMTLRLDNVNVTVYPPTSYSLNRVEFDASTDPPRVVQGEIIPPYLFPHVHPPGGVVNSIDGIAWQASGSNPEGAANVVNGEEKTAETGPMIDDGGGQHHHEFVITVSEGWDPSNSGGAIAS